MPSVLILILAMIRLEIGLAPQVRLELTTLRLTEEDVVVLLSGSIRRLRSDSWLFHPS
jgi:hypothetical protein